MSEPDPLEASRGAIVRYFDARRPRAYKLAALRDAIYGQREGFGLPESMRASQVLAMLEREGLLREARLHSDEYRGLTRYLWKDCTPIEIASTVRDTAYMSHGTAVFLAGVRYSVGRDEDDLGERRTEAAMRMLRPCWRPSTEGEIGTQMS